MSKILPDQYHSEIVQMYVDKQTGDPGLPLMSRETARGVVSSFVHEVRRFSGEPTGLEMPDVEMVKVYESMGMPDQAGSMLAHHVASVILTQRIALLGAAGANEKTDWADEMASVARVWSDAGRALAVQD